MRLPFLTLVAAAAMAASTAHGAERLAPRVAAPSRFCWGTVAGCVALKDWLKPN